MYDRDQKARYTALREIGIGKFHLKVREIDHYNTQQAKNILKKFGWPSFDEIGKRASNALWLIVQHADDDLPFQKKSLSLLGKSAKRGEAHLKNLAYLTDRVRLSEGKKQVFGNQFTRFEGKLIPRPIVSLKGIDQKRRLYGLGTLAENIKKMNTRKNSMPKKYRK